MSAKVPIYLKRSGRKGKKEKLRDLLSSDMISPPLGDFRHTIHVGSGGERDTFGDVSFLQGKFHLLPHGAAAGAAAFPLARAATVSGREPRLPENASPLLKNAISLPVLGGPQALTLPAAQAPPKPPRLHLDEDPAIPAPPPNGLAEQPEPLLPHAGSLLSLHVDLGPSILEDVLQVMEKHQDERGGSV
ncbi:BORG1 protein, partial [Nothocercus nigrocapillus]|nr:BORG1 protein [Nothocercus nigrocapillus]